MTKLPMFSYVLVGLIALATAGAVPVHKVVGGAPANVLAAGSIWVGVETNDDDDKKHKAVLCIQSNSEGIFDATMWFPMWPNGLLSASGKAYKSSDISLNFRQVLLGKNLVPNLQTEGALKKDTLTLKGKVKRSDKDDLITVTYVLKRVK